MWTAFYTLQLLCCGYCVTDLLENSRTHMWLTYLRFTLWKIDPQCGVEEIESLGSVVSGTIP